MPSYKLVVMTKPVEGREQEYNDWYQNVHLDDLVAIDGVKSAQRFRLNQAVAGDLPPLPYLAIYEVQTNDIDGVIRELNERSQTGRMFVTTALSTEIFCAVYEELGPVVRA
jgi:hypothetical protein